MVLEQAGPAARTRFEFGDLMLDYRLNANGAARAFATDYAFLPRRRLLAVASLRIIRTLGHTCIALGIALTVWAIVTKSSPLVGAGVIGIGALWLLVHLASQTAFTVLSTSDGAIWVMRGKEHDRIMRELERRRRLRLRELHGVRPRAMLASPPSGMTEPPSHG